MTQTSEPGGEHPWQNKSESERARILETIKAASAMNANWTRISALLGVSQRQLRNWRYDDPKGLIEMAFENGRAETGKMVFDGLTDIAKNPEHDDQARVLIHLSKHYLGMSDKSTQTVVTPGDLAEPSDPASKRSEALRILGLEALDLRPSQPTEDEGT